MSDVYEQFKIKILIDGYGVLNDSGKTAMDATPSIADQAVINEIQTGLGYAS